MTQNYEGVHLIARARSERRLWRYGYRTWQPRWWFYLLPYRGGDEWGRLTWVVHVPPIGFLVWAYWTCRCDECNASRVQTAELEQNYAFVHPEQP